MKCFKALQSAEVKAKRNTTRFLKTMANVIYCHIQLLSISSVQVAVFKDTDLLTIQVSRFTQKKQQLLGNSLALCWCRMNGEGSKKERTWWTVLSGVTPWRTWGLSGDQHLDWQQIILGRGICPSKYMWQLRNTQGTRLVVMKGSCGVFVEKAGVISQLTAFGLYFSHSREPPKLGGRGSEGDS